jgi:hypothetical protein
MRWLGFLLIVLATAFPVLAEDWTTADGKTYKDVVVVGQEDDGVRITYTGGVGKIPYYELSDDLQKRFGLDPASMAAKRAAAEKAEQEAALNAATAAAQTNAQPSASTQPAAQPSASTQPTAQPSASTQPAAQPSANTQPVRPPVNLPPRAAPAAAPAAPVAEKAPSPYPGANFSYNETLDVCYLDSPAVDVWPVLPEGVPMVANSPGQDTLTLRITTDGHKPEMPDKIEATFFSAGAIKKPVGNNDIKFLVDGTYVPINEIENADDGDSPSAELASGNISFYLTLEQARSIINGKNINFSVGSNNYRIDDTGISAFRKYFKDIDQLPPASTNFVRSYHKFMSELPSIITVISTVCEYIILGSFAILLAASIAAFVLGVTRFIKM